MEIIKTKTKNIFSKAIKNLASKNNSNNKDVQLLVKYFKSKPEFFGLENYSKKGEHLPLDFLYPAWQDVFGIRNQIPVFIANLINDLSEKNEIPYEEINIIISGEDDSIKKLNLHAYHNGKHLKMLSWDEVFGQEAMIRIMANNA
jgi:hypothetical protein